MAAIPYFVLSPSAIACIVGFIHGPDRTVPTPAEDYKEATIDLVIPAHNEEADIVLCLESILKQTVKPSNIILFDDGSCDRTVEYAENFAKLIGLKLTVQKEKESHGKTPAVSHVAHNSTADVLVVLDADTTLRSENYIEKLVQELYQGVGIACACGVILPLFEKDRQNLMATKAVVEFSEKNPDILKPKNPSWFKRLQQNITNNYREELYLFLQKFIYRGEMTFFGSIINPVGCAVAYRREYLLDVLDHYHGELGFNLTTSEDIFIGFAFASKGYRNIQVQDVYALTTEPRLSKLPKQVVMWSSSFLQSCYYFDVLLRTPFKTLRRFGRWVKQKFSKDQKEIIQKRKIKEAYRQSFNPEETKKYGRPIGWFMFTSALEKISFPTIMIIFMILGLWEVLFITIGAEVLVYTIMIAMMHKNRRIRNTLKSLCYTPMRYGYLLFDFFITLNFAKDIWVTKNREWKK